MVVDVKISVEGISVIVIEVIIVEVVKDDGVTPAANKIIACVYTYRL